MKEQGWLRMEDYGLKTTNSITNMINNGDRTEWSPIRFVIIRVINKIETVLDNLAAGV